jgi:hypothetical protein
VLFGVTLPDSSACCCFGSVPTGDIGEFVIELAQLPVFIARPSLFLCCWSFIMPLTELRDIQLPETGVLILSKRSGVFLFPPLLELMSSGEEKGDDRGNG